MRNYINAFKSLFGRKSDPPQEEEADLDRSSYIEDQDLSCLITIRVDSSTGDFNVIIDPVDISAESASVTGLIMYLLNSGRLSTFFVDAYDFWQKDDPKRVAFTERVMEEWLSTGKIYQEGETPYQEGEPHQQDPVAVKATEVFSTKN